MSCKKIHSRAMFSAALVAFIASSLLQGVVRHYPQMHPDLMDGLRGLCLGIYLALMAQVVWWNGRRTH